MRREKIFALTVMIASMLILGTVIALAKTYWATFTEEFRGLSNQTAAFERQAYQEREKQTLPAVENGSGTYNTVQ